MCVCVWKRSPPARYAQVVRVSTNKFGAAPWIHHADQPTDRRVRRRFFESRRSRESRGFVEVVYFVYFIDCGDQLGGCRSWVFRGCGDALPTSRTTCTRVHGSNWNAEIDPKSLDVSHYNSNGIINLIFYFL